MQLHRTFYVGHLKKYHPSAIPNVHTSMDSTPTFKRDRPLPLIDASRWIVEQIVDHDTHQLCGARGGQSGESPRGQSPAEL
ncbi:hypothetical protein F442_07751 [Phytophthora nicotianae P10297]|uniref:Uncharacterized protein n=1 Tax=Phytophthora nicotianae P10297 TaxID=1317064 RepID=W2ZIA2_PHYNI|nr:hypothetical protein F442_07751 [Phytophthora nicotianae P10297]